MNNAIIRQEQPLAEAIEQVVIGGDLKALTSAQRVSYYNQVCGSIGLNPLTKPFDYIQLNGKLTLYAKRDAADQLRALRGISLSKPNIEYMDDMVVVTIEAQDKLGRTDSDLGAVSIKGLQGEARANAIMKAITKAKRRVTLSLAGLGWLDETEVDSIPGAERIIVDTETGEIVDVTRDSQPEPSATPPHQRMFNEGFRVFGDAWNNGARKWFLRFWSKHATPGDLRESAADFSDTEKDLIADYLVENRAKLQKVWGEYEATKQLEAVAA